MFGAVQQSWQSAGRSGLPRLFLATYYSLGPEAAQSGETSIRDYYHFAGPLADQIVQSMTTTPEAIKGAMQAYEAVGADEFILGPTVASLDQVDRLTDAVA